VPTSRSSGLIGNRCEQDGKASPGLAVAAGQLGHFGEAELGIWEGEAAFGPAGGRGKRVKLVFMDDSDAASLQEIEFAIEGAKADPLGLKDFIAGTGAFPQESDQGV
jgi:hypothetical protein